MGHDASSREPPRWLALPRAGGEPGEELDAETALDLVNLGIVSPVTRDTAGSLYFQELARQVTARCTPPCTLPQLCSRPCAACVGGHRRCSLARLADRRCCLWRAWGRHACRLRASFSPPACLALCAAPRPRSRLHLPAPSRPKPPHPPSTP